MEPLSSRIAAVFSDQDNPLETATKVYGVLVAASKEAGIPIYTINTAKTRNRLEITNFATADFQEPKKSDEWLLERAKKQLAKGGVIFQTIDFYLNMRIQAKLPGCKPETIEIRNGGRDELTALVKLYHSM